MRLNPAPVRRRPPTAAVDLIIIAGHQSNMTGGQTNANGATIVAGDAPDNNIFQFSPNGGLASGDPNHAMSMERAEEPLRYPFSVTAENYVGPALGYAKLVLAANPGKKICIITAGKGGTGLAEWFAGGTYFDSYVAAPYIALKALFPNARLHSVILSPLENEMNAGTLPATVATQLDQLIACYRALAGAANVPIYMGAATPEFVGTDGGAFWLVLLEGAKAAVRNANVGVIGGFAGVAVPGDQVHYTNAANRGVRASALYDQIARTAAFQASAPAIVSIYSLNSQQLTFTSVGAPYYDIQTRISLGSGPWTSYLWVPNADNAPGQSFVLTLPGSGTREFRIVAKARGGDSTSAIGRYTAPNVTEPTRVIEVNFNGGAIDGSANFSADVPSTGSDTTGWTPISTLGSGATAAVHSTTVNGLQVADILTANKRFRKSGGANILVPAGNYSIAASFFYDSLSGTGAIVSWGQASINGDIHFSLANSGANVKIGHTNSNSQILTTGNAMNAMLDKWVCLVLTYDRTANTAIIYLNGVALPQTGTLTQRGAAPSNSGGTDLFGNGADSNTNGFPLAKLLELKAWSQVLTADEVAVVQSNLATKYAITFG